MGITIEQIEKAVHNNSTRDIEDREIIVGLTRKGEPFPTLLSSWLLGGQTQQGKSVIAAWFVMWFIVAGAQIVLLDPHKHNKKRGLFTKIEPLREWFAREPIDCLDVDELLSYIDWLEAEYRERKRSMIGKSPLLLVADEFNELLSSGLTKKQAERVAIVIGNLARGGAKHGIFVLAIGHNFDLASAGGNAVRRNIIGRVSVSAEIGEMCNILDFSDRTRLKQIANNPPLRPGQAIVKVPGYGLYRLHFPYITPEYLTAFAAFLCKIGAYITHIPAISTHQENLAPAPLVISIPNASSVDVPPTNMGTSATNRAESSINISDSGNNRRSGITAEERAIIETAARIQLQETGGVNRSKLLRDIGWQNRNKGYQKVKAICDEHDWKLPSKQDISPTLRKELLVQANYMCSRCGSTGNLTIDHIVPRVKGGGNEPENLRVLCRSCNSSKGVSTQW
jgi:hypothetical protein